MTIDEISEMWEKDGKIDPLNLTEETINIPKLHNKYYKIYVTEGLKLKKLESDLKRLTKLKTEYYRGELDDETLKEMGWEPCRLRIMKSDVGGYLSADNDIINAELKIGYQKSIVSYLESIVSDMIRFRSNHIGHVINWSKFQMGQ